MIVNLSKKKKNEELTTLSKVREHFFGIEKAPLNEEYGAYDTDFTDANILADLVFNMFKNNEHQKTFEHLQFKDIQQDNIVKITLNFDFTKTNASISSQIKDKTIIIDIIVEINPNHRFFGQESLVRNQLVLILSHELSHIYSEKVKYTDKQLIQEIPNWYIVVSNILDEIEDNNNIVFIFAFGLYLSWYEEIQAFANQVFYDIGTNVKDREEIMKAFYNSDAYQNYSFIKNNLAILKSLSTEQKTEIINNLQEKGLNTINLNNFNSYIKQIEYGNERGLEKIYRALNLVFKKNNLI